jgi:hypothetical protein
VHRFALALVLLALVGCGRGDDERAASAVTERFLTAVEAEDGAAACALLSPATAGSLEASRPCDEAVTDLDVSPGRITRAQVFSISAKVDVAGGESYFLEHTRAGWRITAAGCTPLTPDEPYDCEAEA